jgi:hypothetical protein
LRRLRGTAECKDRIGGGVAVACAAVGSLLGVVVDMAFLGEADGEVKRIRIKKQQNARLYSSRERESRSENFNRKTLLRRTRVRARLKIREQPVRSVTPSAKKYIYISTRLLQQCAKERWKEQSASVVRLLLLEYRQVK